MTKEYEKDLVLSLIDEGYRTKNELILHTGFSDRKVRNIVHELRRDGHRIVSLGKGYKIAESPEEYAAFRRYYTSYIAEMAQTLKAMDSGGREDGQIRFV